LAYTERLKRLRATHVAAWLMATFDDTAVRFSSVDWKDIGEILEGWSLGGLGREIVRNIRVLERFLPVDCMEALLKTVLACRGTSPDVLEKAYQKECRNHVRRGGPVKVHPVIVGCAVELEALRSRLRGDTYRAVFYNNEHIVDLFIDRLLTGVPLSAVEMALPLSVYTAWATWDRDDLSADPFRFGIEADHIRASLGLNPENWWSGKRLILLVYAPGSTVILIRPTVADAELHAYFEPPTPPEDRYGLTKVWHFPAETNPPVPLPESVHAPAPMSTLDRARTRDIR
jgi:hypothetical protein